MDGTILTIYITPAFRQAIGVSATLPVNAGGACTNGGFRTGLFNEAPAVQAPPAFGSGRKGECDCPVGRCPGSWKNLTLLLAELRYTRESAIDDWSELAVGSITV